VVHWSIPVNDLAEAENFYGEILGLEHVGRLVDEIKKERPTEKTKTADCISGKEMCSFGADSLTISLLR
jgi:catechol 2,3-dioxygenase-like lactoylglutathione lyase family enzyme